MSRRILTSFGIGLLLLVVALLMRNSNNGSGFPDGSAIGHHVSPPAPTSNAGARSPNSSVTKDAGQQRDRVVTDRDEPAAPTASTAPTAPVASDVGHALSEGCEPAALHVLIDSPAVVERESVDRDTGETVRTRIVRANGKYPFVRIEERHLGAAAHAVERRTMVADHVVVRIRDGATPADVERVAAAAGLTVRAVKPISHDALLAFDGTDLDAMAAAIDRLGAYADVVARPEPDLLVFPLSVPNDPLFTYYQWGLKNYGQNDHTPHADVHAVEAWSKTTGSRDVLVGIIDSGIDYTHVDLSANVWINPGEVGLDAQGRDRSTNGIDDDGNGYVDDWHGWNFCSDNNDPMDEFGHGTMCAGIVGACGNNGIGVCGVCWQVSLVPLKFISKYGFATSSDAAEAIAYATRIGCRVTNNSWTTGESDLVRRAIVEAGAAGAVFVAACGNGGNDAPVYPASFDLANIISVADSDADDHLSGNSSYGATNVDLAAPGSDIWTTAIPVVGQHIYGYKQDWGTSMAAPFVTGACALLASYKPSLNGAQIKDAIMRTTDRGPGTSKDRLSIVGKCVTNGRLNIAKALSIAVPDDRAHLVVDGYACSDGPDGDGVLNMGETCTMTVTVRNVGRLAATAAVAHVTTPDPTIAVLEPSLSYGALAAGASATGTFRFAVSPVARSHTARFEIELADEKDATVPSNLEGAYANVVGRSLLAGRVSRRSTSAPIPGAVVTASGTESATTTTDADGRYAFIVDDGSYSVAVSAAGMTRQAPRTVTAPTTQPVDFALGRVSLAITPTSLEFGFDALLHGSTGFVGSDPRTFTVTNRGDQSAVFEARSLDGYWSTSGQWHPTCFRDHSHGGSWYFGDDATHTCASGTRAYGTLALYESDVHSFAPFFSFWSWRHADPGALSRVEVSTDVGTSSRSTGRVGKTWETVLEVTDSTRDWRRYQVDLSRFVGRKIQIRFVYDGAGAGTTDGRDGNESSARYEGWYIDDIENPWLEQGSWLSVDDSPRTLPPGEAVTITATAYDPGIGPGTYLGGLLVNSNDADVPTAIIPGTLRIDGGATLAMATDPITIAPASGGGAPAAGIVVRNTGGSALEYAWTSSAPWLTISPLTGSLAAGASIRISVARNNPTLPAGKHRGVIAIATNDPNHPLERIDVQTIVPTLPALVDRFEFTVDNVATEVWINGELHPSCPNASDWTQTDVIDDMPYIDSVAVRADNFEPGRFWAGFIAKATLGDGRTIVTDAEWRVVAGAEPGPDASGHRWTDPEYDDSSWPHATVAGPYGIAPWGSSDPLCQLDGASWIWAGSYQHGVSPVYLRRRFRPLNDRFEFTVDNAAKQVWVNGKLRPPTPNAADWEYTDVIEEPVLDTVAIRADNFEPGEFWAGFIAKATLGDGRTIVSDGDWRVMASADPAPDVLGRSWTDPAYDDSSWPRATVAGPFGMAPWGSRDALRPLIGAFWIWAGDAHYGVSPVYLRRRFAPTVTVAR